MKIATWNVNSLSIASAAPGSNGWPTQRPTSSWPAGNQARRRQVSRHGTGRTGLPQRFSGQKTYNGIGHPRAREMPRDDAQRHSGLDRPAAARSGGQRRRSAHRRPLRRSTVGRSAATSTPYKLDWLAKVTAFLAEEIRRHRTLVVLGDFNIAPDDRDVRPEAARAGCVARRPSAPAAPVRPRPARRFPSVPRGRPLQLVGLPPGRLPPQSRPAHRPGAAADTIEAAPQGAPPSTTRPRTGAPSDHAPALLELNP